MGSMKFNKVNNRRKRTLPGIDHYVGLAFYSDDIPSGFDTQLVETAPETKATATITITDVGTNGDYLWLYVVDPTYGYIMLASYFKAIADNTTAKVATSIAALINQPNAIYSATVVGSVVTVHARAGLGNDLNGQHLYLAVSQGSTIAASETAWAGGADATTEAIPAERIRNIADLDAAEAAGITSDNASIKIKILHYHIEQMFRINPDAVFTLGVFPEPGGAEHTFNELEQLRTFANNKLTKIGVWTTKPYDDAHIALLQDQYDASFNLIAPVEMLYAPNLKDVEDDDLPDVSEMTSGNVHLIIAQDGSALGKELFEDADAEWSVGAIGLALGAASLAKVHENWGWVEKFNLAVDGGEFDVPALSNGTLVKNLSTNITKDEGTFDTKRLIFLKKYPGQTGTYFNDTHGCISADDDYAYMEDNTTIDKAIRGIYQKMMPSVNGPSLYDKNTKKLRPETVSFLEVEAGKALEEMEKAGELSGYTVTIDPDQDSYNSGTIEVDISNTAVGVNRRFRINIGF